MWNSRFCIWYKQWRTAAGVADKVFHTYERLWKAHHTSVIQSALCFFFFLNFMNIYICVRVQFSSYMKRYFPIDFMVLFWFGAAVAADVRAADFRDWFLILTRLPEPVKNENKSYVSENTGQLGDVFFIYFFFVASPPRLISLTWNCRRSYYITSYNCENSNRSFKSSAPFHYSPEFRDISISYSRLVSLISFSVLSTCYMTKDYFLVLCKRGRETEKKIEINMRWRG